MFRQMPDDLGYPHHREILNALLQRHPRGGHFRAANSAQPELGADPLQLLRYRAGVKVSRVLTCNEQDFTTGQMISLPRAP
jgi:hypothetical protein